MCVSRVCISPFSHMQCYRQNTNICDSWSMVTERTRVMSRSKTLSHGLIDFWSFAPIGKVFGVSGVLYRSLALCSIPSKLKLLKLQWLKSIFSKLWRHPKAGLRALKLSPRPLNHRRYEFQETFVDPKSVTLCNRFTNVRQNHVRRLHIDIAMELDGS